MMSSSELRKVNKPLVERRRRERINGCLDELKTLLVNNNKQFQRLSRSSKLEKVDILELAVQQIRSMQQQNVAAVPAPVYHDVSLHVNRSYEAGYTAAAEHTKQFILSDRVMNSEVKQQLLNTLTRRGCLAAGSDVTRNSNQKYATNNNRSNEINVNENIDFGSPKYDVGSFSNRALALNKDVTSGTVGCGSLGVANNIYSFGPENNRSDPHLLVREEVRCGENRVRRPTAIKRRAFGPLDNVQRSAPSSTVTLATLKHLETNKSHCGEKETDFFNRPRQHGASVIDNYYCEPNIRSVRDLKSEVKYFTPTPTLSRFGTVDDVLPFSSQGDDSIYFSSNKFDVNQNNCYPTAANNNWSEVVAAQSPVKDSRSPALTQNVWRPW